MKKTVRKSGVRRAPGESLRLSESVFIRVHLWFLFRFPRVFRFLLAAARQRIQKPPPIIHDEPQPVALLIMLAQVPEQQRLYRVEELLPFSHTAHYN